MSSDISHLKNKCVLIAEDDTMTRVHMIETLSMFFGKVISASDGEEAYWLYEDELPDIVIADIEMPKKSGLKLARMIRQKDYKTPFILVTSFTEKYMLLDAANLSLDGYLVKPIELGNMIDTILKAIDRAQKEESLVELGFDIIYNPSTKEIYQRKELVQLGNKEHELLKLLINSPAKTFSKDEISQKLWPLDSVCSSAIKNLILRIRKKLCSDLIVSVSGRGYRLATPPMSSSQV